MSQNTGSCPPRRGCAPFYVAQATYTACCPDGKSITITREGRSPLSVEHAHQIALRLAQSEAEATARCVCYEPARGMPYPLFTCPVPDGPNHRFLGDLHVFQLKNLTTGKFHTISVVGPDGAPSIQLQIPGEA